MNGTAVISGSPSGAIPLAVGVTPITTVVTAQNGSTKTYTVNVTREPVSFVQWQNSFFGSSGGPNAAPDADPDFDGITNLLEYVLGGVPVGPGSSDTTVLPICSKTPTSVVFSYRRTKSATQQFFTIIETTSTLTGNDWAPVANETIEVLSIDTLTELVTATVPLAPAANSLFVRLRVESKP